MNPDQLRRYAENLVAGWPPIPGGRLSRLAALLQPALTPAGTGKPAEQKKAA